jgi:hypothetical protein
MTDPIVTLYTLTRDYGDGAEGPEAVHLTLAGSEHYAGVAPDPETLHRHEWYFYANATPPEEQRRIRRYAAAEAMWRFLDTIKHNRYFRLHAPDSEQEALDVLLEQAGGPP